MTRRVAGDGRRRVRRALAALGTAAAAAVSSAAVGACAPSPRDAAGDTSGGTSGDTTRVATATTTPRVDSAAAAAAGSTDASPAAPRGTAATTPGASTAAAADTSTTPRPRVREAPGGLAVTLERRPCHGTCPVYRVSVRELTDGRAAVRYAGERNVARTGAATDTVGRAAVARLAAAVERADYFALPARYAFREPSCPAYATDAPVALTTVRRGTRAHGVEHDYGCAAAPETLTALEATIDSVARTARWVGRR